MSYRSDEREMVLRELTFKLPEAMDGDPRCAIAIGSQVEKQGSEGKEKVPDGTEGTVIGNFYVEETGNSWYLVEFPAFSEKKGNLIPDGVYIDVTAPEGRKDIVLVRGSKLKQI